MRVLRPIPVAQRVQAPRLRMADDQSDRHSTWTELFYDLVFVVAVAAVAKRVTQVDPLPAGLVKGDHYDVRINFELNSEQ